MAHGLWGANFHERTEGDPAWHKLGNVWGMDKILTASDAYEMKPWHISLETLTTSVTNPLTGEPMQFPLRERAIMRHPVQGLANSYKNLGIVGPEYHLITPKKFCEIWDAAVNQSIDTWGVLHEGSELFITIKLPSFSIKGDEHHNYLITHGPWNGINAIRVFQAPQRVVCNNTYQMALGIAQNMFRIQHTANAEQHLFDTLRGSYQKVVGQQEDVQQVLTKLAETPVRDGDFIKLVEDTFRMPNRPGFSYNKDVMDKREAAWEVAAKQVDRYRQQTVALFEGLGWGSNTAAFSNTAYGFVNSVNEAMDHGPEKRPLTAAYDKLFGKRADYKRDGMAVAMAYAGIN